MELYRMTVTTTFGHNVAVWAEDEYEAEARVLQAHENGKLKFNKGRMCCDPEIERLDDDEDTSDPCVVLNPKDGPEDSNG